MLRILLPFLGAVMGQVNRASADFYVKHRLIREVLDPGDFFPNSMRMPIEMIPEHGLVEFEKVVYRTQSGVVLTVVDNPNIFVKYMLDCDNDHSDIYEYYLHKSAGLVDLAIPAKFLSSPRKFESDGTIKTSFLLSPEQKAACKGTIRFMVLERTPGEEYNRDPQTLPDRLREFGIDKAVFYQALRNTIEPIIFVDFRTANIK